MSSLPGLFDSFDNLDQIDLPSDQLKNYLANKILYPRALSLEDSDMKADLLILREALKINGPKPGEKTSSLLGDNPFLNVTLRKIIIPGKFLLSIPNLIFLTWAFVDGLLLNRRKEDWFEDLWTVVISNDADEIVGSVLIPQFEGRNDFMDITILDKNFKVKAGSLIAIPCLKDRCKIAYKFASGKILGKKENALEIYGGRLGLLIDGRT